MHIEEHYSPLILTYATAIFELADEQNVLTQIGQEFEGIRKILYAVPTLAQVLADPGISRSDRAGTLRRAFEGRISPLLMKFIDLLNQKGRLGKLGLIAGAYAALLEEKVGKVEVDVTVPQKLDPAALAEVARRVSAALKRDAVVHQYVDEELIGGLVLRVQDKLIDGSVRAQIATLREKIFEARPH